ncbi:MAG: hypothetical protein HC906_12285 [Bacteroidales bacterium]|nr:hypothetical protein [Bacteroidales bacterium]
MVYVLDWKNDFVGYRNNGIIFRHSLEKEVISMHLIGNVIAIVGKDNLYHYSILRNQFINISNFVKNTKYSFDNGHHLFLVDEEGKGTCTDSELIKRYYSFYTTKGAIPVCSDTSGNYAIFNYPDKTSVLLKKGKIIKSHHNSAFLFLIVLCQNY